MESSVSAMAQRAREALGLESGSQAEQYLKYRQQHVHNYPSEYSLGEYSVAEPRSMGEVERLKPKYTECQKVHKLTARTGAQWLASMVGVVAVGLTAFAVLAIVKKDEKFEREVVIPAKSFIQRLQS